MNTITDIEGVYAGGLHCGIKEQGRPDLAFIYVPDAVGSAGVFTKNLFAASCVRWNQAQLSRATLKACVMNSGSANAGTGPEGAVHTRRMAEAAAHALGLDVCEIGVTSTGCIGKPLPIDRIEAGLAQLLRAPRVSEGGAAAAAIMTTDTRPKQVLREAVVDGKTVRVAGIAKGSGMIAPNMATMLAFMVVNVGFDSAELQQCLSASVDDTFNMVSVDGDQSTNDTVLAFATGEIERNERTASVACDLLNEACRDLAKQIAADGEGATRLLEVQVCGAAAREDARRIAHSIIDSPLVKTAMHGADPNWGRIVAAAGKVLDSRLDPDRLTLTLQGRVVFTAGQGVAFDRAELAQSLKRPEIVVVLDLNLGSFAATAWGCDMSARYVEINTEYS